MELYNNRGRPLILDGAMGSFLQQLGSIPDKNLWHSKLCFDNPELLLRVHKEYINSGAEIITTNTFRTNPIAIKQSPFKIDIKEIVTKNIKIALDARSECIIIIAGSNAPAEDCYQKERNISKYELEYNHKKHIEILWENGVDIIWNETQSHWDEIEIIAKFCSDNSLPFSINLFFDENLKLLSGEPLIEIINFILDFNPVVIGFNCIKPNTLRSFYNAENINYGYGFYFNCGEGNFTDDTISCGIQPLEYIHSIQNFISKNTFFVGSCCGSTPLHTKAIRDYFDEIYRN